jgi:hypothetical protein
LAT